MYAMELQQRKTATIRVLAVDDLAELAKFELQWNDLVSRCATATPMSSFPWLSSYFCHFAKPPTTWVCLMAVQGDLLVGVLPLVRHQRSRWSSGQFVQLPNNPHTISVDAVLAPEVAPEVFRALLAAARARAGRPTALAFQRIREDSPTLSLTTPGLFRSSQPAGQGAFLPIPADFAEYRRSLSRNFRNNLNKAANKLRGFQDVRMSILSGSDAEPDLLSRFTTVEAASWKGGAETAIQCSPVLLDFYADVVRHLNRAGWLEWHVLEADGQDLAANLCIRLRRSLFVWKLGYDAAFSNCSPGSLLLEHVVRQLSTEQTIDEIDLMTDQHWYRNWGMAWRSYWDSTVYWKGTLLGTTAYCSDRLRDRLRRHPLRHRIKRHFNRGNA
jgi:CelD/BcsL family acetyltransferase involved in cellulose biosynthesis